MLVMIKQKYFDAIKAGTKTAEIRTKPAKVGDRVLFLCGKEKLNAVVENCEEWNSGHLTEFSGQPWWDEFCEKYTSEKKCYVWRLHQVAMQKVEFADDSERRQFYAEKYKDLNQARNNKQHQLRKGIYQIVSQNETDDGKRLQLLEFSKEILTNWLDRKISWANYESLIGMIEKKFKNPVYIPIKKESE